MYVGVDVSVCVSGCGRGKVGESVVRVGVDVVWILVGVSVVWLSIWI